MTLDDGLDTLGDAAEEERPAVAKHRLIDTEGGWSRVTGMNDGQHLQVAGIKVRVSIWPFDWYTTKLAGDRTLAAPFSKKRTSTSSSDNRQNSRVGSPVLLTYYFKHWLV
jgi:hypothetical protein